MPFHTHPEKIESAKERAAIFFDELHGRIRGKHATNGSHGNPSGKLYPPISQSVAQEIFSSKSTIYRNAAGEKRLMQPVADYFTSLGIINEHGRITVSNIAPGYGVTNLYSVMLSKIKADCESKYWGKKPVLLTTAPGYGLFSRQPEDVALPIVTLQLHEADKWKLQAKDLERAIAEIEASGDKKVAAFLNMNPHNPTGAILEDDEMQKMATIFREKDVFVIDDMVYHGIEHGDKKAKPFASIPGMFDRSITLYSLSKAFCAPGIRAAAACGRVEDIKFIRDRNSVLLDSIAMTSELALSAALSIHPDNTKERGDYLRRNNDHYLAQKKFLHVLIDGSDKVPITTREIEEYTTLIRKYIPSKPGDADMMLKKGIPGVRMASDSEAGFFALIDFSGLQGKYCGNVPVTNSTVIAAALADYGKTMMMPSGYMLAGKEYPMMARVSYSMDLDAIMRMARGIRETVARFTDSPNPRLHFDLDRPEITKRE